MNKYQILKATSKEWDEIILLFDDSSIYQTYAYGRYRWGEDNLEYRCLYYNNNIVAAVQITVKTFANIGIVYIPWGPLWKLKNHKLNVTHLHTMLEKLIDEFCVINKLLLSIHPNVFDDDLTVKQCYIDLGFKEDACHKKYRTFILDTSKDIDAIKSNLTQSYRRQLKKAEKLNIIIKEGTDKEIYKIFLDTQREMLARKKYVPGVDYEQFGDIQEQLPQNLKMNIIIGYKDDNPVCSVVSSLIGDKAIFMFGATTSEGLKLHSSYLLQWKMIYAIKCMDCNYYDLGGIDPYNNQGVYQFKSKLAGKTGKDVYHLGPYYYTSNKINVILYKCFYYAKKIKLFLKRAIKKL